VVLGAGMGGLLAAGVLSEFYEAVTVVDRDELPPTPMQRKGIPQGLHLHRLLSRGRQVLDDVFPGLLDELVAAGARIEGGDLSRVYVRVGKYALPRSGDFRDPAALVTCAASRPFLEFHVRRRVCDLGNVRIVDGHDVVEPVAPTPDRITGVRVTDRRTGHQSALKADLVVDAMGRAARTPALLEKLGYGRPPERHSAAGGTYASQFLRIPDGLIVETLMMVQPGAGKPGGLLASAEHDTWVLSVGQLAIDWTPPADLAELLSVAEQFTPPSIMTGLRAAQPIGDIAVFHHRGATWRRYEEMPRFPAGLLVIGDALCSFNPIYGQGMTIAALQALALREYLAEVNTDEQPQRFFSAAANHIGPTWAANRVRDNPPSTLDRQRGLSAKLADWTMNQLLEAARNDIAFTEVVMRVNNLVDPPARLRDRTLIARTIAAYLWRRVTRRIT
jgi:2-polyprenyl-6-methoxyphenol hydroxylase-like FAD-dependent oxidoreductase